MKKLLLPVLMLSMSVAAYASHFDARADIEARPERAAGVYFAYPTDLIDADTSTPKGYEPFYISHYGRHGSRYLIGDADYERVIEVLSKAHDAGALSAKGEMLRAQVDSVWVEAKGHGGELSPLGARQHRGIARRMATAYPAVFADGAEVKAASTQVMRCAHSMFNFVNGLRDVNPAVDVPMESSFSNMWYLCFHTPESGQLNSDKGPYYQDYRRFKSAMMKPDRLMNELFADKDYLSTWVDQARLYEDLYWLAADLQNMETPVSLLPYFTTDELYDLWRYGNFAFFCRASTYPRAKGVHVANAKNLLGHIVDNADDYIARGAHGATLRFGHDGNIIPLLGLLRVEGCYADTDVATEVDADYADYFVSPMGTNIQFIFFRPTKKNKDGEMLVRVIHNERAAVLPVENAGAPGLYKWSVLRPYLKQLTMSN